MADVKPAEEAIQNPTEVKVTEELGKVESDAQTGTHGAAGLAKAELVEDAAKSEKQGEAAKDEAEESSKDKSEVKAANGDRDDRNGGRYERGNKRYNNDRNDKNRTKKPKPNDEFEKLPETDDPSEIRDQVEFYFSNHNLTTDEHMFKEMRGPFNKPISLKHLSTFKRMRRFQPYTAIVAALRESESLVLVDDGEYSGPGNEGVKRKDPIDVPGFDEEKDDSHWEDLFNKFRKQAGNKLEACIYAKGFGDLEKAGQIAIEKFFRPYGAVVVRKRRDGETNKWKGSVFVEFESTEAQEQFLALDPKPKFNENELSVMGKKQYNEMKCKEKGIQPGYHNEGREHRDRNRDSHGRGRGRGGRGRGDRGGRGGGRGRYNDRSDRRDSRRDRSRSPRERRERRDRRDGSADSRDWNDRRDRFQKSRDYKNDRRGDRKRDDSPKRETAKDENGVPIVRDTRGDDPVKSNKRKAEGDHDNSPKKSKIEIKEDA